MKTKTLMSTAAALLLAFGATAQIKIFPGGNSVVGATVAPASGAKFHVTGNSCFTSTTSTITSAAYIRGLNAYSGVTTPDFTWYGNDQTGLFHPAANIIGFTIGGGEAMRIYNNKKLFIGTQPNTGNPSLDGQITIANLTTNERAMVINHTASIDWVPAVNTNLNRTNSTSYGVTLNGTSNFYVTGGGWVYNAGGIYNGSDFNLKDDIKGIDSASAKINKIKGVTYTFKKEKQNPDLYGSIPKRYMGVIAQDIEKVAPEAVKIVHDGTKAVCYDMLIGLLIEGFKEQSAKVAQLQNDLNNCCTAKTGARVRSTTSNNNEVISETINQTAQTSFIKQNKPNPFNSQTTIEYNVTEEGTAAIMVFDMSGKLLKTLTIKTPGQGSVIINSSELYAGMFFYSLVVNGKEVDTKKMILTEQ